MTDVQPVADILDRSHAPSLSATSDMPVIDPAKAAPVDEPAKPVDTDDTVVEKPAGEDTGADPKPGEPTGGEPKPGDADQTPAGVKAAMSRMRNERKAAELRASDLESKLTDALAALKNVTGERPASKDDPRPSRDAFTDPEAYDKALIDWSGRRATEVANAAADAQAKRNEQVRTVETAIETFKERKAAFETNHPDFDDLVYNDEMKFSPAMTEAILNAEDGPAIAYHLGQNPEVAERIAKLSPVQAVYEIGKISLRLTAPVAKPKPDPIRALGSRSSGAAKAPDEMSMAEYAEYRKTAH